MVTCDQGTFTVDPSAGEGNLGAQPPLLFQTAGGGFADLALTPGDWDIDAVPPGGSTVTWNPTTPGGPPYAMTVAWDPNYALSLGCNCTCTDSDACTADACDSPGVCNSGPPPSCDEPSTCEIGPGSCNATSGACQDDPVDCGVTRIFATVEGPDAQLYAIACTESAGTLACDTESDGVTLLLRTTLWCTP